jgi:hypothetical protein
MVLVSIIISIAAIPLAISIVVLFSRWYTEKQRKNDLELVEKAKVEGPSVYPTIIPDKHTIIENDIIIAGILAFFITFMLFYFW